MPLQLDVLEYLNENSLRAYPFITTASRTSVDGILTIPNDLIADLLCSIDSDVAKIFYISRIDTSPYATVISLATGGVIVGTFTITENAAPNSVWFLSPTNAFVGANGKLIIGNSARASLLALPQGTFLFSESATQLEPRCFLPSTTGVNRITFTDVDGNGASYTGTVVIRMGGNLAYQNLDDDTVRLNAADGLGLNTPCEVVSPILTINGQYPDEDGKFYIDGIGITMGEITNGISLENQCTEPCAGCDEISELLRRVMVVENNLLALKEAHNTLLEEYNTLTQALACSCTV
jgi:hypothetical protein